MAKEKVNMDLASLKNGAVQEQIDAAMQLVAENVLDPNTDYKKARKLTVSLTFKPNEDRDIILKLIGNVKEENSQTSVDDGVTQTVSARTGVAAVENVIVPNPVTLMPYRTFQEVDQPESEFVFRMKEGPSAALFEGDGGQWRNKALLNIKNYLEFEIKETDDRVKVLA